MAAHPGVYCLRSSETEWDEETLWRTYATLTDVEAVFRSLKSELGLRPIFHRKEARAEGHLFIAVLPLVLRGIAGDDRFDGLVQRRGALPRIGRATSTFALRPSTVVFRSRRRPFGRWGLPGRRCPVSTCGNSGSTP